MSEHLTEYELQDYIENPDSASGRKAAVHLENCDLCKSRLSGYTIVFHELKHAPDFNIDDKICSKIVDAVSTERAPFFSTWHIILISLLFTGAICYTAYLTNFSALALFKSGISSAIKEIIRPFTILVQSRSRFLSLGLSSLSAIAIIALIDTFARNRLRVLSGLQ